jgi:hypothetical protein
VNDTFEIARTAGVAIMEQARTYLIDRSALCLRARRRQVGGRGQRSETFGENPKSDTKHWGDLGQRDKLCAGLMTAVMIRAAIKARRRGFSRPCKSPPP